MAYADYAFYRDIYKGKLSEADFETFSERSSDVINSRTDFIISRCGFNNFSEELQERIKKACCAGAEAIHINNNGGVKTSEKVGDYSISYAASAITAEQRIDNALMTYIPDIIKTARWC